MIYEYRNAEGTIIAATNSRGHVVILEPDHPFWEVALEAKPAPFVPPAPPPPPPADPVPVQAVSRFQARAALLAAGLLEKVEAAVAAADPFTRLAWTDATEFRRDSPTIAALADAVGLSGDDLDQLFEAAAGVRA